VFREAGYGRGGQQERTPDDPRLALRVRRGIFFLLDTTVKATYILFFWWFFSGVYRGFNPLGQ
jgi:hypothetical protein